MDKNFYCMYKVMTESNIHLELGDIIEFKAPSDPNIHNKRFYINYIDNTEIDLLNDEGEKYTLKISLDGAFENESIEEVDLLDRASSPSYAVQHNLLPETWINIYFDGDIPTTVIGKITNLIEDQIEVSVWDRETKELEKDPLYIDFAYKGLPKDIPIESIDIREASPAVSEYTATVDEEDTPSMEVLETEDGKEVINIETLPDINQQLSELITEADQIVFGEELEVFTHEVDVPEEERKYSIEKQTADMLDDLLSNIPNKKRTPQAINNIHKLIERYKQLRSEFSIYDNHNNIIGTKVHGDDYKPLVDKLNDLSLKLYWTLPVVKISKKLYNIDSFDNEVDVTELDLANIRSEESNLIQSYKQNEIAGDNKYFSLIRGLKRFYTPYDNPSPQQVDPDNLLAVKEVNANINAVVDNLNNFESSVAENSEIKTKKFLIQGYTLGTSVLRYSTIKRGNIDVSHHKLTPNDTIFLQSLLILPEAVFNFSRINLPGTSILHRANLNNNFINYWQLLTKNKEVNTKIIESVEKDNDNYKSFLKTTTEYILSDEANDMDKYNKFLNTVIPKTTQLLDIAKDKISSSYSMSSVIKFLEPFMVYHNDLTYKQYKDFLSYVTERIVELKRDYIKTQTHLNRTVSRYTNSEQREIPYLMLLLGRDLYERLIKLYDFAPTVINEISNSTFLSHIMKLDYGRYYNTLVAKSTLSLMIPNGLEVTKQLEELYKQDSEKVEQQLESEQKSPDANKGSAEKKEPCNSYILSKKYTTLEELEADNDKNIYFDKEYDKTYYDMIDEPSYKKIIKGVEEPEEKISQLAEKLVENVGLNIKNALREAEAMVSKKRAIINGDYCVLIIDDGRKIQNLYFIRTDNKWVRDTNISDDVFGDTSKQFCNLSEKCMIVKDTCETLENSEKMIKNQNLLQVINEFDRTMYESQENISATIERKINKYMLRLPKLVKLKNNSIYKYNNQKYYLGDNIIITEELDSPHAKLRDKIFGIPDLTQRQNLICDFSVNFTKPAVEGQDKWWRYCNETNTKLLPTFIVELAIAFINNDNYLETLNDICKRQGKLSDDGEAWVDKYSGYFITYIDF